MVEIKKSVSEVQERLKAFMTDFVRLYELYLIECHKRLFKSPSKTGKILKSLNMSIGVFEGTMKMLAPVIGDVSSWDDEEQLKMLTDILYEFDENPLTFRRVFLQASAEIFRIYENQFLCIVSSDSGLSWRRAMIKMAHDAVFRAVHHHTKHPATENLFLNLTKGVILGSFETSEMVLGHEGHTVDFNGCESYTTEVFEGVGLKVDDTYYVLNELTIEIGISKFVRHRQPSLFMFRLLLEGEDVDLDKYTKLDGTPRNTYNYLLTTEMLENAQKAVEDELNQGNVEEYVWETLQQIKQEGKGDAYDLLDQVDEIPNDLGRLQITADNTAKSTSSGIETRIDLNKEDLDVDKRTLAKVDVIEEDVDGGVKDDVKEIKSKLDEGEGVAEGGSGARKRICFNVSPPDELFTGRSEELALVHSAIHRNTEGRPTSCIIVVCGMGGVGKTQLLRKYVQVHGEDYDDVLWLDAENEATLNGSFHRLARDELGLETKDANGGDKEVISIVEEVYEMFSGRKYLIIFDNVDVCDNVELKYLRTYLPSSLTSSKPSILISSQYQEWDIEIKKSCKILLGVLSLSEARELVKRGLDIQDDSVNREIEALVEELHCFPLAIQQAIAYIAEKSCTSPAFGINKYLDLFKKKSKKLLDSNAFLGMDNDYSETTFTTWNAAIDKILKDEQYGQIASEILNVMAYISSVDIDRDFFRSLADGSEERLRSAVRLLVKFSIVSGKDSQSILSIHRLLQIVIRIRLAPQGEFEVMIKAYTLFCLSHKIESKVLGLSEGMICKNAGFSRTRFVMKEHFESLLEHLEKKFRRKRGDEVDGHRNLRRIIGKIIEEILDYMICLRGSHGSVDFESGDVMLLQKSVAIKEKLYGPDDSRVADARRKLNNCVDNAGERLDQGPLATEEGSETDSGIGTLTDVYSESGLFG